MSDSVRFDRFELLVDARQLLVDGAPLAIGGRAFDLLRLLVQNRGRVVSKSELMEQVWPGLVVVDNNLNAQVANLRRTLGPDAIVTVTGRGYRFALVVHDQAAVAAESPVGRLDGPSIAVLPFANLSSEPSQDYFADAMAADIITALSRFEHLAVINRNSSFGYRGQEADLHRAGRELGVRYLLAGRVQRSSERLRISVQLIETAHYLNLWAETFDGSVDDVFDLQDEIAARCASAIEPSILKVEIERARRKHPGDRVAYDLRVRALPHLYAMNQSDNEAALPFLQQALTIDPGDASTLAHAAWCYEQRLSRGWPNAEPAHRLAAASMAKRALAVGSDDATAIGLAGFVLVAVGDSQDVGLAAVRRATALNPNHALVRIVAGTAELIAGRVDDALAHLERARCLSPHDPGAFMVMTALACANLFMGRPREAIALCAESVAQHPEWDFTWWVLAAAAGEAGQAAKAHEAFQALRGLAAEGTSSYQRFRVFSRRRREALFEGLQKAGFSHSGIALPVWLGP